MFFLSFILNNINNYLFDRKIAVTEREQQYLQKNKAALDEVEDKYRQ